MRYFKVDPVLEIDETFYKQAESVVLLKGLKAYFQVILDFKSGKSDSQWYPLSFFLSNIKELCRFSTIKTFKILTFL